MRVEVVRCQAVQHGAERIGTRVPHLTPNAMLQSKHTQPLPEGHTLNKAAHHVSVGKLRVEKVGMEAVKTELQILRSPREVEQRRQVLEWRNSHLACRRGSKLHSRVCKPIILL